MSPSAAENAPPLPPMWNAVLDRAGVERLFDELAIHARVLSVNEKGAATAYASGAAVPLKDAGERLLGGQVRAVQVRYRHDGKEWCDTLTQAPGGWRLVRCAYE